MPSLDLPGIQIADKIMVRHVTLDRIGLLVRYTVVAGYYETDADGQPVPNSLGFPTFRETAMLGEYAAQLAAPQTLALIAAREAEAQAAMAAGTQALALCDDYLAQLCLDHYQATVLAQSAEPEVLP